MIKSVCFMVMPFGKKKTQASDPGLPGEIDFDRLWDLALRPTIEALGYEPIRADEEVGALIVPEMIERLAYADLVIAEMTLPNANVYYEVGIRHAAQHRGCVLVAANWSKPAFDVDQMRRLTYPLPQGAVDEAAAAAVRAALTEGIRVMTDGASPVFQALPGYPAEPDLKQVKTFKDKAKQLSDFQAAMRTVRRAPKAQRAGQAVGLVAQYKGAAALPSVALDMLNLLQDGAQWQEILGFVGTLEPRVQDLPVVRERYALALAKAGQPQKAIEVLEVLLEECGESSERRGLLGGRYKELYKEAADPADKARYLDAAIEHYERGMALDLNDYYPSSNLPRLYRLRGEEGDEERARRAALVALMACERARGRNPSERWIRLTLLGAAFDAGDAARARGLAKEILKEGAGTFQLGTTLDDLEQGLSLRPEAEAAPLRGVIAELRKLLD